MAEVIKIKRGLDIPLAGAPDEAILTSSTTRSVALLGLDYVGIEPDVQVAVGDRVSLAQVLMVDRGSPGVSFTAPASGTVAAINRGARRRLQSVVISCDDDGERTFRSWSREALSGLDRRAVREILIDSGLWTAFRTRPFSRVPRMNDAPASIFVSAIDTNPHAPKPKSIITAAADAFTDGVAVLTRLTEGVVHVCVARADDVVVPESDQIRVAAFSGPHPAGLPGTHIHMLAPVGAYRTVWYVNYQDVIAIGRLFTTGRLDPTRIVSIAGPHVRRPRLVRTVIGASIDDLVTGELLEGPCRVISGSVLSGRRAVGTESFLGRYHLQVSVLGEAVRRELLGWLAPGFGKFSAHRMFPVRASVRRPAALTTAQNGSPRALVPIGSFERVMPLDLLVTPLLKALLVNDLETAEALGCLQLDEEDLALCSFVCCSKYDYGEALREVLGNLAKTA